MLFRLTNTLILQQALLNNVLYKYLNNFCMIYLDNIIIYIKRIKENHIKKVKKILQKLEEYNLLLKLSKCKFLKKKVTFLEHVITIKEVKMNSDKMQIIMFIFLRVKDPQLSHSLVKFTETTLILKLLIH